MLLLATAAACSPDPDDTGDRGGVGEITITSPPAVTEMRGADGVAGLVLPIEAYRLDGEQRLTLDRARSILIDDCMRRFGIDRRQPAAATGRAGPEPMSRRYGVTDPAVAARWGYHLAPGEGTVARTEPGAAVPPAEMLVWTGSEDGRPAPAGQPTRTYQGHEVPAGGCAGEAGRELQLTSPEDIAEHLVTSIDFNAFDQARTDNRVRQVVGRWSACMHEQGYNYVDPLTAAAAADLRPATPSTAEKRTATADVACKTRNNVVGVWFSVESAYQTAMIQAHAQDLRAAQQRIEVVARNAQAVLDRFGG
ncbi:hypothetical protein [Micromonospora sp. NPDC005979]|uniref:hypothetical protein n=1 Tax=Micromonospora sp. NPDC005979 TaxID=3156726 RepID=UPI0033BF3A17